MTKDSRISLCCAGCSWLPFQQVQLAVNDLTYDFRQVVLKIPVREVGANLREVRNVTNVVADPVRGIVVILQRKAHVSEQINCFQNREAVLSSAAQVINLAKSRMMVELQEEAGHIAAVNLIAHLLAFVTQDRVRAGSKPRKQ